MAWGIEVTCFDRQKRLYRVEGFRERVLGARQNKQMGNEITWVCTYYTNIALMFFPAIKLFYVQFHPLK